MVNIVDDLRVCTSLEALHKYEQQSHYLSLPELGAATSRLTGRLRSGYRGRGLNFEEFRQYQLGDDSRNIDWPVTMRTGEPHIRVYSEEKERPIYLIVDQTSSMFFSSVEVMKSVACAEIASLCGWMAVKNGDRIGGVILCDDDVSSFASARGRNHWANVLKEIAAKNRVLPSTLPHNSSSSFTIDDALACCIESKLSGALLIMISDFFDVQQNTIERLSFLKKSNNLLAVSIADSMENKIDSKLELPISNGLQQTALPIKEIDGLHHYHQRLNYSTHELKKVIGYQGVPLIQLDTSGDHINQFLVQLTGRNNVE
jgi:uncharacterized protein (DUF58 family)